MGCDLWGSKIGAYANAELSAEEMRAMGTHLRACGSCTADVLNRVQFKRTIHSAGKRYSPSVEFRQRVEKEIVVKQRPGWVWSWAPRLAGVAAILLVAIVFGFGWSSLQQRQAFAELADVHVATLASAAPVYVVSTDRHTVKPWFQGKLPFTFNLPELGDSAFTLEGGRMAYFEQAPGAQLIYRIRNHRISVFIFQKRVDGSVAAGERRERRLTFNVETWDEDDLRYFVIGDADGNDIHRLSEMLRLAGRN